MLFFDFQVQIKQEKLSDSEEESRSKITAKPPNMESDSDSDESTEGESTRVKQEKNSRSIAKVKQEKVSPECSSSSDSSDDESETELQKSVHRIKTEKIDAQSTKPATFIPRPIKVEPQSDVEGKTKFKKPSTNYNDGLNVTRMSGKTQKRKRESSISEQLDSIVDNLLDTTTSGKRKKSKSNASNIDENLGDLSVFQTPVLSSTLKIKQEPQSEDESAKRKKSKKSLKSMESDLFDSFLK